MSYGGGAADDAINGGAGIDTAIFAGTLAQHVITAGGIRATLTSLYTAAFGRTPDQDGLGYWLNRVDHADAPTLGSPG